MPNELGEHGKRLFEVFNANNNNFQKYFTILLGLSFFFVFFLIIPYSISQINSKEISNSINQKQSEIQNIMSLKRNISDAKEGLLLLKSEIETGNKTISILIEDIRNLKKSINLTEPTNSNDYSNFLKNYMKNIESTDCQNQNKTDPGEQAHCSIGEQFKIQYANVNNLLENNVNLSKLRFLGSNFPILNITKEIKTLQDHFNITKYDDEIYHNTTKWEKVISEGVNKANLFYDKYQNKIDKEITNLENLSQIKSKELTGLNNNLIELKENQEEIEKRIEGFESPIGKLTIGFNDLLIIFPFALLIGFILIVSYLIASMNIRRKLIKFYPNSVENNNVVNENDIADVAPLWIDPKNKEQNKFIRWLVLIFPLILFIMSFTLTKNNWFPYLSNYGIKENDIIISNVIFAFSIILFIYSYYKVYKEYTKK